MCGRICAPNVLKPKCIFKQNHSNTRLLARPPVCYVPFRGDKNVSGRENNASKYLRITNILTPISERIVYSFVSAELYHRHDHCVFHWQTWIIWYIDTTNMHTKQHTRQCKRQQHTLFVTDHSCAENHTGAFRSRGPWAPSEDDWIVVCASRIEVLYRSRRVNRGEWILWMENGILLGLFTYTLYICEKADWTLS